MGMLEKKIDDNKFLNVIRKMLKAGYMEEWKYNKTYSGTPQGGILSPPTKLQTFFDSWPLFVKRWDLPQTGRQNLPVSTGPISCLKMVKHYTL